jgi:hypothetical protein
MMQASAPLMQKMNARYAWLWWHGIDIDGELCWAQKQSWRVFAPEARRIRDTIAVLFQ